MVREESEEISQNMSLGLSYVGGQELSGGFPHGTAAFPRNRVAREGSFIGGHNLRERDGQLYRKLWFYLALYLRAHRYNHDPFRFGGDGASQSAVDSSFCDGILRAGYPGLPLFGDGQEGEGNLLQAGKRPRRRASEVPGHGRTAEPHTRGYRQVVNCSPEAAR